jgi:hypothetical protein
VTIRLPIGSPAPAIALLVACPNSEPAFNGSVGDFYRAPHSVLTDLNPGSTPPTRDLFLELAAAVEAADLQLIAYVATQGPAMLKHGAERANDFDGEGSQAMTNWSAHVLAQYGSDDEDALKQAFAEIVIDEYAARYGTLIDGWWFDHAGFGDMPRLHDAVTAHNPEAAAAFNDGQKVPLVSNHPEWEDYTFGHPTPVASEPASSELNLPMDWQARGLAAGGAWTWSLSLNSAQKSLLATDKVDFLNQVTAAIEGRRRPGIVECACGNGLRRRAASSGPNLHRESPAGGLRGRRSLPTHSPPSGINRRAAARRREPVALRVDGQPPDDPAALPPAADGLHDLLVGGHAAAVVLGLQEDADGVVLQVALAARAARTGDAGVRPVLTRHERPHAPELLGRRGLRVHADGLDVSVGVGDFLEAVAQVHFDPGAQVDDGAEPRRARRDVQVVAALRPAA